MYPITDMMSVRTKHHFPFNINMKRRLDVISGRRLLEKCLASIRG